MTPIVLVPGCSARQCRRWPPQSWEPRPRALHSSVSLYRQMQVRLRRLHPSRSDQSEPASWRLDHRYPGNAASDKSTTFIAFQPRRRFALDPFDRFRFRLEAAEMRLLSVWKRHADIPFWPHLDLDGFKCRLLWRIDHTHHMTRREPRSQRQKIACRSFLPVVRNGLRELARIAAAFGVSDISAASIFLEPRF
jgi:hypothetical protein